jgi:hypothetical protein
MTIKGLQAIAKGQVPTPPESDMIPFTDQA